MNNHDILEILIDFLEEKNNDIFKIAEALKIFRNILKKDMINYTLYHYIVSNFIPFHLDKHIEKLGYITLINDIYTLHIEYEEKKILITNNETEKQIIIYYNEKLNNNLYEFISLFYDKIVKIDIDELKNNNIKYELNDVEFYD